MGRSILVSRPGPQSDQIDVEGILYQPRTSSRTLERCGRKALSRREGLQRLLFPKGLKWERGAFRTQTTCVA
jgi:hypothetical protein